MLVPTIDNVGFGASGFVAASSSPAVGSIGRSGRTMLGAVTSGTPVSTTFTGVVYTMSLPGEVVVPVSVPDS